MAKPSAFVRAHEPGIGGQVAIVTGASSGRGQASVMALFVDGGMTLYPGFRGNG